MARSYDVAFTASKLATIVIIRQAPVTSILLGEPVKFLYQLTLSDGATGVSGKTLVWRCYAPDGSYFTEEAKTDASGYAAFPVNASFFLEWMARKGAGGYTAYSFFSGDTSYEGCEEEFASEMPKEPSPLSIEDIKKLGGKEYESLV